MSKLQTRENYTQTVVDALDLLNSATYRASGFKPVIASEFFKKSLEAIVELKSFQWAN